MGIRKESGYAEHPAPGPDRPLYIFFTTALSGVPHSPRYGASLPFYILNAQLGAQVRVVIIRFFNGKNRSSTCSSEAIMAVTTRSFAFKASTPARALNQSF